MNSADKRIEELLNRAGQTITDLPRKQGESVSEPYSGEECVKANGMAWRWYLNIDTDMDDYDSIRSKMVLKMYILHLTDIIDRFEWALENVCGERDYLRTMAQKEGCRTCIHHTYDNHLLCENEGKLCSLDDRGNCENYEYEGVPEDWSVDDG